MKRLSRRNFLALLWSLAVTACGGGGSGGSSSSTKSTQTPATGASDSAPLPAPVPSPPPADPPPAPSPSPAPTLNVIERENAKTAEQGVTDAWQIADWRYAAHGEIEGYASATSVGRGDSIRLYVSTIEPTYTIEVYRIGWYGGKGGRLVAGPIQRIGARQPPPSFDPTTRLVECAWSDPYVLAIPNNRTDPTDWASGVYLAKLTGDISGKQSYIVFTVRDDPRKTDLLFQCSVTTYAAYNNWGGYSLYDIDSLDNKPAYKVSFNRPYRNPERPSNGMGAGDFLSWELLMVRFLEREGFDVAYCTNLDVHARPSSVMAHRAFLSIGHDEYWTKTMRDAVESARDAGIHLAFFGADPAYWQIRLEPGADGQPSRTLVCYKYDAPTQDPLYNSDPMQATTLWRNERPGTPGRPEAALVGVMYDYNSLDSDIVMSDTSHWICADTGLQNGAVLKGMLGYEVDRVDPRSSPRNIEVIASSPYVAADGICEGGSCTGNETRYSQVTFYTAPSGAGVFATGSMQWNWGLDAIGPGADRVNSAVQTMTRNVLRRFVAA
jgi:hypothetical protein